MGYQTYHDALDEAQAEAEAFPTIKLAVGQWIECANGQVGGPLFQQPNGMFTLGEQFVTWHENGATDSKGFQVTRTFDGKPAILGEADTVFKLPMVDAIDAEVRKLLSPDAIQGRAAGKSAIQYAMDTAAFIARGAALRAYQEGLNQGRAQQPEPENPLIAYLRRQWDWSLRTFGPGLRTEGICDHIGKELKEVRKNPHDLMEWLDIVILALDGYWRHGGSPERAMTILQGKQDKNFARNWPDWRTMREDKAIEHDRTGETV